MLIPRRKFLSSVAGAGILTAAPRFTLAEAQTERATRATPIPRIKDISVIECEPQGVRLTVVKITTDQDGLYGYGCATFTQRADLVKPAVERYLKPFLVGKTTDRIEDIWQSCYDSSYWKNGPVLNNAISGIDQALWDIKGPPSRHARLPAGRRQVPRSRRCLRARQWR
jgi:mannonate dehydratase